jgi:hypothetical protein
MSDTTFRKVSEKYLDQLTKEHFDFQKRIKELEAWLKQTREWRDYYRSMWMGASASELEVPLSDDQLQAIINAAPTDE